MLFDIYFFQALGIICAVGAALGGVLYASFKWKRFGKIAFIVFILVFGTLDVVMCSDNVARVLRPEEERLP